MTTVNIFPNSSIPVWRKLSAHSAFSVEILQLTLAGIHVDLQKSNAMMDDTGTVKVSFTVYYDDLKFLELREAALAPFSGFRLDFTATGTINSVVFCTFYLKSNGPVDTNKFLPHVDIA